jgi:hypothetical protein
MGLDIAQVEAAAATWQQIADADEKPPPGNRVTLDASSARKQSEHRGKGMRHDQ